MKIQCPRARKTEISARGPSNTTYVGNTLGLTLLKNNKSCFFCRHRLGLKSHSRLKRVPAPPQPPTNRFWSSRFEKYDFESISDEKFFFRLFFREELEGPQVSEISASNKSGKIGIYEVRAQKSATFDPPKPRPQNLVWDPIFKACHISLIFWIFDSPQNVDGDPSTEIFFAKFEKITCLQCQKFTLEALCCRFFSRNYFS